MSLHILQLGPYPPPEGGVARNVLAIRDTLQKGGDKCSILVISPSTNNADGPDVYHQRSKFAIIRILATLDYDVMHLHVGGNVSRLILALALTATLFSGKRSVLTMHSGAYPLTREGRSAKPLSVRGMIFRRFGKIITVNDALVDVFRRYGVAEERIHMVLPFALRKPDDNVTVPANLLEFFASHSPVLLAVGGLEPEYDPLFQIRAMGEILKDLPNAGLMIVGDGSLKAEVEAAVAASGYPKNIHVAGNVDHAVTLHLIDRAAALLRTTLFDGDAISVREALFLGTPVIATDTGLRPHRTELIAIGDVAGLVQKVKGLERSESKQGLSDEDGDRNIEKVIEIYRQLL